MAKLNLKPTEWNTKVPITRDSLIMMGLGLGCILLMALLIMGPWYQFATDSKDKEDGDIDETTMTFKVYGMGFYNYEKDEYGEDETSGTVKWGDGFSEEADKIKNTMLIIRVLCYLGFLSAVVMLGTGVFSMVHSDKDHVKKIMLFSSGGVLLMALLAAIVVAVMMPGAIDEDMGDKDNDKGYFETIDADKSLFGDKKGETEYYKNEVRWRPDWAWFLALTLIPGLAGFSIYSSRPAKDDEDETQTTGALPGAAAAPAMDWTQQATYQDPAQAAAAPQYQLTWAQCTHCFQQQQAYSTGQPQVLTCPYCQQQYTTTV